VPRSVATGEADARITLRLRRRGTRCTGAARQRVCACMTTVLAQQVVHARTNRQDLVTRSVALGYSPANALRATLGVRVWTRYGADTHVAAVLLQPACGSRQRQLTLGGPSFRRATTASPDKLDQDHSRA
jgi:hypothetical protein